MQCQQADGYLRLADAVLAAVHEGGDIDVLQLLLVASSGENTVQMTSGIIHGRDAVPAGWWVPGTW